MIFSPLLAALINQLAVPFQQPDFAGQQANHNVIFRIPTPTFGAG